MLTWICHLMASLGHELIHCGQVRLNGMSKIWVIIIWDNSLLPRQHEANSWTKINTMKPRQGYHFADYNFHIDFIASKPAVFWLKFHWNFIFRDSINTKLPLVQMMAWHSPSPVPLTTFRLNSKLDQHLCSGLMNFIDHIEILHPSRQCNCHDMCKISLWSVEYVLNYSTPNSYRISNSIEIPLVGQGKMMVWRQTDNNQLPEPMMT